MTTGFASSPALTPTFIRDDERGRFVEIVNRGPWETVVTAFMGRGAVLGNHYHRQTRILMFLISGRASVFQVHVSDFGRQTTVLEPNQGVMLEPNWAHAIEFHEDSECLLLKSRPYSEGDPDTYSFLVGRAEAAVSNEHSGS